MFFQYGETECAVLRKKDRLLGLVIDHVGQIERPVNPDLFSALMDSITGQQISTKAHKTVWHRMCELLGEITPERVAACDQETLQQCGISMRKAGYLKSVADEVHSGRFDLAALQELADEAVCHALCSLSGVGRWTAEMLMIFSMQRPDVISYGDLAIRRGLCLLYGHRELTPAQFERYRRRYSPHASVAGLFLWALAGDEYPELPELLADARRKK